MRAPPRLRSERLDRWIDALRTVWFMQDEDAYQELLREMREAWRDELAEEARDT